jgi:hypothetical protein
MDELQRGHLLFDAGVHDHRAVLTTWLGVFLVEFCDLLFSQVDAGSSVSGTFIYFLAAPVPGAIVGPISGGSAVLISVMEMHGQP